MRSRDREAASIKRLRQRDIDTLCRAADLRKRFDAGIFPNTAGDWAHFRRLERLGLLELEGTGRDIDGLIERDVWIFNLTDAGTAAIDAWCKAEARRKK